MRTLILLRHAKAVAYSPEGDFNRELAPRGRAQADRLGRWLADKPFAPALVYASPARRTRETADLAIAALPVKPERIDQASLYNADADEIIACEPIYETFPGWEGTTFGITEWDKLPANARAYLGRVQAFIGAPIDMVSTGPDRDHTILLRHPYKG